jgi:hypothetical protein
MCDGTKQRKSSFSQKVDEAQRGARREEAKQVLYVSDGIRSLWLLLLS